MGAATAHGGIIAATARRFKRRAPQIGRAQPIMARTEAHN